MLAMKNIIKKVLGKKGKQNKGNSNVLPGEWVELKRFGFLWRLQAGKYVDDILRSNKFFEPDSIKLIEEFVKPGAVVLDIGANFGYYSLMLSRLVGNEGKIVAFEPTEHYRERLIWHIKSNNIHNVRIEGTGLSDKNETIEISIGECSATLHWIDNHEPRLKESIKLVKLDDWWKGYIEEGNADKLDFIKIDIDGHEPNFIRGATSIIEKHRPMILTEVNQDNLFQTGTTAWDFADMLENLGYILCDEKTGEPFEGRREYLLKAGNFSYSANILCVPKDQLLKSLSPFST